MKLNFVKNISI